MKREENREQGLGVLPNSEAGEKEGYSCPTVKQEERGCLCLPYLPFSHMYASDGMPQYRPTVKRVVRETGRSVLTYKQGNNGNNTQGGLPSSLGCTSGCITGIVSLVCISGV